MEDPRIISALFIFLKMAYYNVLINTPSTQSFLEYAIFITSVSYFALPTFPLPTKATSSEGVIPPRGGSRFLSACFRMHRTFQPFCMRTYKHQQTGSDPEK